MKGKEPLETVIAPLLLPRPRRRFASAFSIVYHAATVWQSGLRSRFETFGSLPKNPMKLAECSTVSHWAYPPSTYPFRAELTLYI
jgi:hypothetical protein